MTGKAEDDIWAEGRRAFFMGISEDENPYAGLEAEYWSDGWEDGQEDAFQATGAGK